MAKILVTGAAGFIGSHTVDQLLAAGHAVWGVDNFRTGKRENLTQVLLHEAFALRTLDVAEGNAFFDLVGELRPDVIIHLAALVSVPESIANPVLNDRLNLRATRIVAEAACKHQVPRIVFASSAAVYGDSAVCPIAEDAPKNPLTPYGSAKLASEVQLLGYAAKFGLTVRCLRYFNVYGPRMAIPGAYVTVIGVFLDQRRRGLPLTIHGDGSQTRDFTHVRDAVRANLLAMDSAIADGRALNIGRGRNLSVAQIAAMIGGPVIHLERRPGDARDTLADIAQAREVLGWAPEVATADGIRELMAN